ncbi:MAG TPA: DUF1549 and DUF1553 domain-containing protein, partial [Gemmata sp.]|nr:DUF1549 and DUF1553 domain-containing protein [Gemmata sp.]
MPFRSLVLLALAAGLASASDPPVAKETWWAFRALKRPEVPKLSASPLANPVDRFILAKLSDKGLSLSPEADRRTLIRRVTFDLTGLPPSPEEVEAFVNDRHANAYERLVDRLLASPAYGERFARLWMDAVHFAETHGHDQDRVRPNAWRYRDYLIHAFNADTPYAKFVQEQVSADVQFPDEPKLIPALGFLAAGPWDESSLRDIREDSIDREVGRYLDRDDIVTTVFNTFQGLTVQCARCHDHKFDAISQEEYYRLQAVFAGVGRGEVEFDEDPAIAKRRRELRRELAAGKRHAWLVLADLAALPRPALVYAAAPNFRPDGSHKPTATPREVHMLKRGDIRKPGDLVDAAALSLLPKLAAEFSLKRGASEGARRGALSQWLTSRDNPLTWRVMANRVWQWHFGTGLVGTPNDFGKMGQQPTHAELLDWLACELREHQSLKKLHRLIVTSATYKQSSTSLPDAAKLDPDNKLLWRQNRTRLDAEQVRDAILAVSGRLDRTMGGPSDMQFDMKPGIHVTPKVDYGKFDWDRPQGHRRSVYRFVFRTLPDPLVACLDGADGSTLTPKRTESVTAPQALAVLNNEFVLVHAKALAARLEKYSPDRGKQIEFACRLAWGRPPTADEAKLFATYADRHGLANLCRVLFNTNEFLFLD